MPAENTLINLRITSQLLVTCEDFLQYKTWRHDLDVCNEVARVQRMQLKFKRKIIEMVNRVSAMHHATPGSEMVAHKKISSYLRDLIKFNQNMELPKF